uniref:Sulfatase N-terminal domain-containing protein n=1 Tax=Timema tahoe TaxID=61484 RepID=A0A7R9P153_9NEOP|nr:unnamed protein product [Timema tahoe]
MSVGKVFHPGVSSNWSDDQPYSWSQYPYHPSTQKYKESAVCSNSDGTLGKNIVCPVEVHFQPGKTLPDLQSLHVAMKFLKERQGSHQPFLLAVGFHKPHVPLKYPRKYLKHHPLDSVQLPDVRQRPSALPTVAWNPWTDLRERDDIAALNLSFPFQPIPDWYGKLIKQSYYAAVTYIDDLVGQLTNQLDITGHSNDTIILLIGDHGWSMAEHGEWSKFSNFDVAVNVPFLLSIPGQTEGCSRSSHALVELVDIFPTLVELAELPGGVPPLCPDNSSSVTLCTEGISLVPLIQQEIASMHQENQAKVSTPQWKSGVFSQYPRPGVYPTYKPNSDKPRLKDIRIMGYTLRTQRHKYTEWVHFDDNKADWSQVIARELYDHKLDSGEDLNLADRPQFAKLMGRLSQQLRAGWRYSLPKHMYTWENYHSS